jgi:hypothetical protein
VAGLATLRSVLEPSGRPAAEATDRCRLRADGAAVLGHRRTSLRAPRPHLQRSPLVIHGRRYRSSWTVRRRGSPTRLHRGSTGLAGSSSARSVDARCSAHLVRALRQCRSGFFLAKARRPGEGDLRHLCVGRVYCHVRVELCTARRRRPLPGLTVVRPVGSVPSAWSSFVKKFVGVC